MAMVEKLDLPFPLLSDPKGDLIKSPDLWNEEEGVSEPAIVVVDRSGTVRRLYSGGKDFSGRDAEEARRRGQGGGRRLSGSGQGVRNRNPGDRRPKRFLNVNETPLRPHPPRP